ncbi:MAG: hypothetical protein QM661_13375 [Solimonas sp.]
MSRRRRSPAAVRHAWFGAMGTAIVRLALILLATLAAYLHRAHPLDDPAAIRSFSAGADEPDLNHDGTEARDIDNDGVPEL